MDTSSTPRLRCRTLRGCTHWAGGVASLFVLTGWGSDAGAHVELLEPPARYPRGELKDGPCGRLGGLRSGRVTVVPAGSVLTVRFEEYIDHPGHYRIALDMDGDDDFEDPQCLRDCDGRDMEIAVGDASWILADGIEDAEGGVYEVDVRLPETPCEQCTLQLIQVMTDKPPYTLPGDDLYYQCADLRLIEVADVIDAGTGGAQDSGGGGPRDAGREPPVSSDAGMGQEPAEPTADASGDVEGSSGCRSAGHLDGLVWFGLLGLAQLGRWRRPFGPGRI